MTKDKVLACPEFKRLDDANCNGRIRLGTCGVSQGILFNSVRHDCVSGLHEYRFMSRSRLSYGNRKRR